MTLSSFIPVSRFSLAVLSVFMGLMALTPTHVHAASGSTQKAESGPSNKQPVIMGWIEYVHIQDLSAKLKAKLDTGATTSSMRGEILKVLEPTRKGEKTSIVFQVEDSKGKVTTLQRNLVRWVKIKGKSGKPQKRPVIEMHFCIAGRPVHAEVNLAPRKDFVYPILVGRNMLREANIIVDSTRSFTARAQCPDTEMADETAD